MKSTIQVSELNLADWQEIASALGKDKKWAYHQYKNQSAQIQGAK